ncbi:Hypothetical_protein [Hexamita inflata]|uniref:Hypothetical_protein n=1 Tax=Hexamita inflata TaxID=28002 RepID=A0AA86NGR0_9EUKA|nr:Hypothetical protein HINF_LOCUS6439 [Hexamita inflata]
MNLIIQQQQNALIMLIQQINCTSNYGYQIVNGSCIKVKCNISGQISINGICQCTILNSYVSGNACVCPIYARIIGDACICILAQQILIDGVCVYAVNKSDEQMCSLQIYITTFNIDAITNIISGQNNFSSGYVFSASKNIENSYIVLHDNVYPLTFTPLFQNQSWYNNIKIEIGTQIINNGSLISNNAEIIINRMKIVSRKSSYLSVSNGLTVLSDTISNANISSLLLYLTFIMQQGNITLINNICGLLNLNQYQVNGSYLSSGTVALIGLNVYSSTITICKLTFQPDEYNVGNYSSYLISTVNFSQIVMSEVAILIGNNDKYTTMNSLSSNITNIFQFGGLVNELWMTVDINIKHLIYDCYQIYNTYYITKSGLIIGDSNKSDNTIKMNDVCFKQEQSGINYQSKFFGVVGYSQGNISIIKMIFYFTYQGNFINSLGIVGYQTSQCVYSEIIDLITEFSAFVGTTNNTFSPVIADNYAQNCLVKNIMVQFSNFSCTKYGGGIIAASTNCSLQLQNTSVLNSNIYCQVLAAGAFVGYSSSSIIIISNSIINNVNISSQTYFGLLIGQILGSTNILTINNSYSFGNNYINDILQQNCAAFADFFSISGC